MAIRNIKKNLATMQDLAQGVGEATQNRNNASVTLDKIDVPFAVNSVTAMQALDITLYTRARVYTTTIAFTDYIYDPSAIAGIAPDVGTGYWVEPANVTDVETALNQRGVSLPSVAALYGGDWSQYDYLDTVAFADGGSVGDAKWYKSGTGGTPTTNETLTADHSSGYVVDTAGNIWSHTPQNIISATRAGLVTGGADNAEKMQAFLDAGYVIDFTEALGVYKFDSGIAVWKCGSGWINRQAGARWNVRDDSNVTFEFDDEITTPALTIGGRNGSGATSSGFYNVEDFLLEGVHLRPETSGGASEGILFDGSNTDATYGTERGICRGGTLRNITTKWFSGKQWRLLGNVFDIKLYDCFGRQGLNTIYQTETSTVNVGVARPGQIDCISCGFFGPDRGDAGVAADAWAVRASYTNFMGGHIQGQFMAELGFHAGVHGTHIEADPGAENNDAVQIIGKSVRFFPENLNCGTSASSVGVKIGDGTGTSVSGYRGFIPLLQDAATGILVTDGGARTGHIDIGFQNSVTTSITDNRLSVDSSRDFTSGDPGANADGLVDLSGETYTGLVLGGANNALSMQMRTEVVDTVTAGTELDFLPANRGNWTIWVSVPSNGGSQYSWSAIRRSTGGGSAVITSLGSDAGTVTLALTWPTASRPILTPSADVTVEVICVGSGAV